MNEYTFTFNANEKISRVYGLISVMVENSSNYLFVSPVTNSKMVSIFVLDDVHVEGDADNHVVAVDVFRLGRGSALSASALAVASLCRVRSTFCWFLFGFGVFF